MVCGFPGIAQLQCTKNYIVFAGLQQLCIFSIEPISNCWLFHEVQVPYAGPCQIWHPWKRTRPPNPVCGENAMLGVWDERGHCRQSLPIKQKGLNRSNCTKNIGTCFDQKQSFAPRIPPPKVQGAGFKQTNRDAIAAGKKAKTPGEKALQWSSVYLLGHIKRSTHLFLLWWWQNILLSMNNVSNENRAETFGIHMGTRTWTWYNCGKTFLYMMDIFFLGRTQIFVFYDRDIFATCEGAGIYWIKLLLYSVGVKASVAKPVNPH